MDDQRDSQRAEIIARAYAATVNNLIEVTRPLQVLVQAHLLEVGVSDDVRYNFNWGTIVATGAAGGTMTVPNTPPVRQLRMIENVFEGPHGQATYFGAKVDQKNNYPWEFENINRLDPLFLTVNWLVNNNKGRLLANPRIVTRSGEVAEINVGGQIPYRVVGATGTPGVQLQPFGTVLNVTPVVDHKGNINTKLNVNVSNVDLALSTPDGYALRTRSTRSEVSVKDGEHIVVSGILQEVSGKSFDKVPYLSRIPILGNLFNSKNYRLEKSELVIIVTPNLVSGKEMIARTSGVPRNKTQVQVKLGEPFKKGTNGSNNLGPVVLDGNRVVQPRTPQGGSTPPDPAARVQPKGADPAHMSGWQANKTAFGNAPGTEPLRAGLPPNPKVATLPPGDNTARGRVQALLGGMKEQMRWARGQRDMDRPIPPPVPTPLFNRAPTGWPPNYDPMAARTYDSVTPRQALEMEKRALAVPESTKRTPGKSGKPAVAPPPSKGDSAEGKTSGAASGAVIISDEELEDTLAPTDRPGVTEEELRSRVVRKTEGTPRRGAPGKPSAPEAAKPNATGLSPRPERTSDETAWSGAGSKKLLTSGDEDWTELEAGIDAPAGDGQVFKDLEAAFDRIKSRAKGTTGAGSKADGTTTTAGPKNSPSKAEKRL
ncbi:MAG: hypothetical protein HY815_07650 [Candidatus Riflebacteria bacterium]|nr:hypothetical protein [Candidatus Riflebacteria bacterium]